MNPNPRVGVLLRNADASVRLYNVLNPVFGRNGLKFMKKHWPEERLRRECPGYGEECSAEWNAILAAHAARNKRPVRRKPAKWVDVHAARATVKEPRRAKGAKPKKVKPKPEPQGQWPTSLLPVKRKLLY